MYGASRVNVDPTVVGGLMKPRYVTCTLDENVAGLRPCDVQHRDIMSGHFTHTKTRTTHINLHSVCLVNSRH